MILSIGGMQISSQYSHHYHHWQSSQLVQRTVWASFLRASTAWDQVDLETKEVQFASLS